MEKAFNYSKRSSSKKEKSTMIHVQITEIYADDAVVSSEKRIEEISRAAIWVRNKVEAALESAVANGIKLNNIVIRFDGWVEKP